MLLMIYDLEEYKYLDMNITSDGSSTEEVRCWSKQDQLAIQLLNSLLWSTQIKTKTKIRTIMESIMTYGAESWATTQIRKNLLITELGFCV